MTASDGQPKSERDSVSPSVEGSFSAGSVTGSNVIQAGATGIDQIIYHTYTPEKRLGHFFRHAETPHRQLKDKLDKALGQAPDDAIGVLTSLIAECDLRAYDPEKQVNAGVVHTTSSVCLLPFAPLSRELRAWLLPLVEFPQPSSLWSQRDWLQGQHF